MVSHDERKVKHSRRTGVVLIMAMVVSSRTNRTKGSRGGGGKSNLANGGQGLGGPLVDY